MRRRTLIVKTGSTMPALAARRGDYEDWITEGMGTRDVTVVDVEKGAPLPDPGGLAAVVVTGSSALVTERAEWSERTGAWLRALIPLGTPTLAICYGHQLLADALGGEVRTHPDGRQMGAIDVRLSAAGTADPLFDSLPETLRVSSSHRQHVARLPEGAVMLASNHHDPNQAYRVGERAWGVQFHPEWDHDVMRTYLEARVEILAEEGFDPDALLDRVGPSDHGERILARFAALAGL